MEAAGPIIIFVFFLAVMAFLAWLPLHFLARWYRRHRQRLYEQHPEMYPPPHLRR